MAIPTKEQFDQVIEAFADFHTRELQIEALRGAASRDALLALLEKRDRLLDLKQERVEKSAAMRWFRAQPRAIKAQEKFFKTRAQNDGLSNEEYIDELLVDHRDMTIEDFQQKCKKDPDHYADLVARHGSIEKYLEYRNRVDKFDRVRTLLSVQMRDKFGTWHHGVFVALRDYYHTDRWRAVYRECQDKRKRLLEALHGLSALQALSAHLIEPIRLSPSLATARSRIEEQIAADVFSIYPIRRSDETAPERTLIYDLYMNNIKHRIGKKTSIICSLMELEGIKNQLGQRNIELLLSRWESARLEYRKKLREISETAIE